VKWPRGEANRLSLSMISSRVGHTDGQLLKLKIDLKEAVTTNDSSSIRRFEFYAILGSAKA